MPTITQTLSDHARPARTRPRSRPSRVTRAALVLAASVASAAAAATAAQAAVVVQCVPTAAGGAVVSGGTAGTCAAGSKKVSLPASVADQATLNAILPYLSYSAAGVGGKPTITISVANVQLVSGSGTTNGAVNATGNLVIGYDESPGAQTGSHNLELGTHQSFTGYGAIVGGSHNKASGPHSTVLGYGSTASGSHAAVTGGVSNTAAGA